MNGLVINLTHSLDDVDRTSVAMVVAGASVASNQTTAVFLSSEGTRLAARGVADDLHEEGFAPLSQLVADYVEAGGTSSYAARVPRSAALARETSSRGPTSSAAHHW